MRRRSKTPDMIAQGVLDRVEKAIQPLSNGERIDVLYDLVEQLGNQLDQEYDQLDPSGPEGGEEEESGIRCFADQ
jgi:hypothetical protein